MEHDKKELLRLVAEKEMKRLNNLSLKDLHKEAQDWFQDEIIPIDRDVIILELVEDYMRYREEESEEELQEILNK